MTWTKEKNSKQIKKKGTKKSTKEGEGNCKKQTTEQLGKKRQRKKRIKVRANK